MTHKPVLWGIVSVEKDFIPNYILQVSLVLVSSGRSHHQDLSLVSVARAKSLCGGRKKYVCTKYLVKLSNFTFLLFGVILCNSVNLKF